MKNDNITGKRIRLLRTTGKITQEQLAKDLGLNNKSSIANYESGYSMPSDEIKVRLAEYFCVSVDYLLGKTDIPNDSSDMINDYKDLFDKADIAFASGIKGLNETNKAIIKSTIEALLAKQEKDEEDKK